MKIGRNSGTAGALLIALAAAGVLAGFALGGSHGSVVGLRATLRTPHHSVHGIFVATLRGRTLRWSIAYKGSSRAAAARLRLVRSNGARPALSRLCSPCARIARGRTLVSSAAANALRNRRVLVDVQADARLSGKVALQEVPTLEIASPKPGQTLVLPAEISYSVSNFTVGVEGGHLETFVAGLDGKHVELPLSEQSGTVTLPDAKDAYLVGRHSLTFRLVSAQGVPLPNPEATVVVRELTIEGKRGR
jgi:hypothetical protein